MLPSSKSQKMAAKELDTVLYIYTQRCAAALYTTFFRGVLHAPTSYLSLGREIDRLSRALEHLIDEIQDPDSKMVRCDNARAASESLGIALDGAYGSLVEVERTLVRLHVERPRTEHWIESAIKTQFDGSEERLQELHERMGYHCWAFDLVMRTLMKNDALELLTSIETMAVDSQLRRMLSKQLDGHDESPLIRSFDELCIYGNKNLFTDFEVDVVIRIVMFWTFRAILLLGDVTETKQISPEGYLDLLKAAWLLQELRDSPRITPAFVETRAVVALVSTELLFTFSAVVKIDDLPDSDVLDRHGDFRIFLEHLAEQKTSVIPTESTLGTIFEQDSLDTTPAVPTSSRKRRTSSTSNNTNSNRGLEFSAILPPLPRSPPAAYTTVAVDEISEPSSPPPPFPPPRIPERNPRRKRKRPLKNLRVNVHRDRNHEVLTLVEQLGDQLIDKLPTPPSSLISFEDMLPSYSAEPKSPDVSSASEARARSPTPSTIIDERYCDSPTLGSEECFDVPVRIEPRTPEPVFTFSESKGATSLLLELSPRQPASSIMSYSSSGSSSSVYVMANQSPIPPEEKIPSTPPVPLLTPEVQSRRGSILQTYDSRAPSLSGSNIDEDSWNVDFAVEYGMRPGEREIIPGGFSSMKLKASKACTGYTRWEDCIIRVFENTATGEYRVLTMRGKNVDQRHLWPATTELVPEYGYHENLPVIFLRKAGPGTYSSQLFSKEKGRRKSSVSSISSAGPIGPPPLATLCYKFHNLFDMFAFQQAFLQESVEADVQNVRSIRYTRGFLSGEHTTHKARIQLWKPAPTELSGGLSSHRNSVVHGQAPSLRSAAPTEEMRVKVTRLVMYLDEIIISVFVTDDIMHAIPNSSPRTLRIRPSSHKAFNNPSSVKACVLGDPKRDISGGFRLDREGLGIDKQDAFDEFKWFELEFQTEAECRCFADDFTAALQQRRRERLMIEELKKKAGRGVKVGEL